MKINACKIPDYFDMILHTFQENKEAEWFFCDILARFYTELGITKHQIIRYTPRNAITSISTCASIGSLATSTQERAGYATCCASKNAW